VVEPGIYHVTSRGNNQQVIFDEGLRRLYLWQLTQIARLHDWSIYGWALMSNHLHLVLEIGDKGISNGMRDINTYVAKASNLRFGRIDHCFGERFWSALIKTEAYFYNCLRYILWNPARAGLEDRPGSCGWTSFRATIGLDSVIEPLAVGRLLEFFGSSPTASRAEFERFVLAGRERCLQPWGDGNGIVT
jgi:REP element-mobilizing transposase RayT